MGHKEHKDKAPEHIRCFVITVSDSRTEETDTSGRLIQDMLKENNHEVVDYEIIKDDPAEIKKLLEGTDKKSVQAIIINGGTGISRRDSTFEAVSLVLEKKIDGFGEIFRYLSYCEIGSPAMMSRAIAGTSKGRIIISIPGSKSAVRLAMSKLILPELGHMVFEANR